MDPADLPRPQRWLYALKPASWLKILAPAILGQAIGGAAVGAWSPAAAALGLVYAALLTAAIVLLNDYGDREVDALKRYLFPEGCSPKTIPDGILSADAVLLAGLGAAALSLGVAGVAEFSLGRPGLTLGAAAALGLLVAYTFRPLGLNYRGGGELLEMFGVGLVLPWGQVYLQGGDPAPTLAFALLPGFALLALASAIASGLADEVSDRRGGKVTVVSRYGNRFGRDLSGNLLVSGALLWALAPRTCPELLSPWVIVPAILVVIAGWQSVISRGDAAGTGCFAAIRAYKGRLNQTIAGAALLLAFTLGIAAVFASLSPSSPSSQSSPSSPIGVAGEAALRWG